MDFSITDKEDVYILKLQEEKLNTRISPDLKAQLLLLIGDESHNKIILDLSDVKYVDSSGLGALLLGLRQARANDKQFALLGTQKRVASLIHIAHLDGALASFDHVDEAIAHLNKPE